jgi:hypothetical protein
LLSWQFATATAVKQGEQFLSGSTATMNIIPQPEETAELQKEPKPFDPEVSGSTAAMNIRPQHKNTIKPQQKPKPSDVEAFTRVSPEEKKFLGHYEATTHQQQCSNNYSMLNDLHLALTIVESAKLQHQREIQMSNRLMTWLVRLQTAIEHHRLTKQPSSNPQEPRNPKIPFGIDISIFQTPFYHSVTIQEQIRQVQEHLDTYMSECAPYLDPLQEALDNCYELSEDDQPIIGTFQFNSVPTIKKNPRKQYRHNTMSVPAHSSETVSSGPSHAMQSFTRQSFTRPSKTLFCNQSMRYSATYKSIKRYRSKSPKRQPSPKKYQSPIQRNTKKRTPIAEYFSSPPSPVSTGQTTTTAAASVALPLTPITADDILRQLVHPNHRHYPFGQTHIVPENESMKQKRIRERMHQLLSKYGPKLHLPDFIIEIVDYNPPRSTRPPFLQYTPQTAAEAAKSEFLVKWMVHDDYTWHRAEELTHCTDLFEEFYRKARCYSGKHYSLLPEKQSFLNWLANANLFKTTAQQDSVSPVGHQTALRAYYRSIYIGDVSQI